MSKNKFIEAINREGQVIWYDYISRDVINNGELENIIKHGVSGLTSNPTIFEKAISGSNTYDYILKELKSGGLDPEGALREVMIRDVVSAAKLLSSVYEQSGGRDGFVSIEVSPLLAYDSQGTISAVKEIWQRAQCENLMVKIPGTKEGLNAIEACLSEGININVTLIFSVSRYEEVAKIFLRSIEKARQNNKKIPASVASFFVSRVDTICEKYLNSLLEKNEISEEQFNKFLGKVGIANSKLAYKKFIAIFGEDAGENKEVNSPLQYPLWASTSAKNPSFHPLIYVENLIGPHTVNTVPPNTLKVLMEECRVKASLKEDFEKAESVLDELKNIGVPFNHLLIQLEEDGVKAFADSYNKLLKAVEDKFSVL